MKKFALIFRLKAGNHSTPTTEQLKERIDWLAMLSTENRLADKGNSLQLSRGTAKMVDLTGSISDGPSTADGYLLSGYLLVYAKDVEEAAELAKSNPVFQQTEASIEVREILQRD